MSGVKCFWQKNCPYYEQVTSYGTEEVKCGNTDCPHYTIARDEEDEDGG